MPHSTPNRRVVTNLAVNGESKYKHSTPFGYEHSNRVPTTKSIANSIPKLLLKLYAAEAIVHPNDNTSESDFSDILTAILFACDPEFKRRRQRCTLDVDDRAAVRNVSLGLIEPLTVLLSHAMDQSDFGSELTITAIPVGPGLEIEIAEATPDHDIEHRNAANIIPIRIHQARRDLKKLSCQLEVSDCPQGGKAYTVCYRTQGARAVA